MRLDEVAEALEQLGARVGAVGELAAGSDPGARAFAGDGPGALFGLGRTLHGRWSSGLAGCELATREQRGRLHELATGLRRAAQGYADAEAAAHQQHRAIS